MAELNFNLTPVKSENHLYNRSLRRQRGKREEREEQGYGSPLYSYSIHSIFIYNSKRINRTLFMIVMSHRRRQHQRQRESRNRIGIGLENRKEKKDPWAGGKECGGGGNENN